MIQSLKIKHRNSTQLFPRFRESSELEKAIDEIEKVEKIESYTAIMTEATVKDFNGADFSMNTVFYNIDDKRTLNNYELVSESKNNVDDPIYIPLYVSNFGGFALNDEIVYAIDGKSHSFTVAGVIEDAVQQLWFRVCCVPIYQRRVCRACGFL